MTRKQTPRKQTPRKQTQAVAKAEPADVERYAPNRGFVGEWNQEDRESVRMKVVHAMSQAFNVFGYEGGVVLNDLEEIVPPKGKLRVRFVRAEKYYQGPFIDGEMPERFDTQKECLDAGYTFDYQADYSQKASTNYDFVVIVPSKEFAVGNTGLVAAHFTVKASKAYRALSNRVANDAKKLQLDGANMLHLLVTLTLKRETLSQGHRFNPVIESTQLKRLDDKTVTELGV